MLHQNLYARQATENFRSFIDWREIRWLFWVIRNCRTTKLKIWIQHATGNRTTSEARVSTHDEFQIFARTRAKRHATRRNTARFISYRPRSSPRPFSVPTRLANRQPTSRSFHVAQFAEIMQFSCSPLIYGLHALRHPPLDLILASVVLVGLFALFVSSCGQRQLF